MYDLSFNNSPRKKLQKERKKLLTDQMKLRHQQGKLNRSLTPNVKKYQDHQ